MQKTIKYESGYDLELFVRGIDLAQAQLIGQRVRQTFTGLFHLSSVILGVSNDRLMRDGIVMRFENVEGPPVTGSWQHGIGMFVCGAASVLSPHGSATILNSNGKLE